MKKGVRTQHRDAPCQKVLQKISFFARGPIDASFRFVYEKFMKPEDGGIHLIRNRNVFVLVHASRK